MHSPLCLFPAPIRYKDRRNDYEDGEELFTALDDGLLPGQINLLMSVDRSQYGDVEDGAKTKVRNQSMMMVFSFPGNKVIVWHESDGMGPGLIRSVIALHCAIVPRVKSRAARPLSLCRWPNREVARHRVVSHRTRQHHRPYTLSHTLHARCLAGAQLGRRRRRTRRHGGWQLWRGGDCSDCGRCDRAQGAPDKGVEARGGQGEDSPAGGGRGAARGARPAGQRGPW